MNLSDFAFFQNLPEKDAASLNKEARKIQFAPNETILAKGSHITFIYFIVNGRIKESTNTHSGKEIIFNMLSEGDCFGLVSLLNHEASHSDFISITNTEVYAIRISDFLPRMRTQSSISDSVLLKFGEIAASFSEKLYEIRALDVPERTRAELLRHVGNGPTLGESNFVEITNLPTHEEIASMIFTHREAVTREISKLKRDGVIIKTKGNRLAANVSMLQEMIAEPP